MGTEHLLFLCFLLFSPRLGSFSSFYPLGLYTCALERTHRGSLFPRMHRGVTAKETEFMRDLATCIGIFLLQRRTPVSRGGLLIYIAGVRGFSFRVRMFCWKT